jgi:hypothetical protein
MRTAIALIFRDGECLACGWCCEYKKCSHQNDVGLCGIYDKLEEYCKEHDENHRQCVAPPKYPLRKWNPACGYVFKIAGTNLEVIHMETKNADKG